MHADELRVAIDRVVDTLTASGILTSIRDYRAAKGDQRPVAAARLGHAGAMLMERMDTVTAYEKSALQLLHLSNLRDATYWQDLLSPKKPEQERSAELVQLYSRVLFASNHLPNFAALLGRVSHSNSGSAGGSAASVLPTSVKKLLPGQSRITIQLSDAAEKASDPDRIARSIDGIDMLYSASASLSRRPAMDLRLDYISGDADRRIAFTGETDSVSAMAAVIDSIPDALADLNNHSEIDLDELVQSLPIFEQLGTLAGHGTFSEKDIRDIRETMHQGALLTLESGMVMPEPPEKCAMSATRKAHPRSASAAAPALNAVPKATTVAASNPVGDLEGDEHYERYLRERAAMQTGSARNGSAQTAADNSVAMLGKTANGEDSLGAEDELDAEKEVEELLKKLDR